MIPIYHLILSDWLRYKHSGSTFCLTHPSLSSHQNASYNANHLWWKTSRFSWIYFQSQKFSSENFLSYYKVCLGLKMADSGPGSGPGLLRYFKPCRKDSCQIQSNWSLCEKLDSTAIEEANKEVTAVIVDTGSTHKPYLKLTDNSGLLLGAMLLNMVLLMQFVVLQGIFQDSLKEKVQFVGGRKPIYRNYNHVEEREKTEW